LLAFLDGEQPTTDEHMAIDDRLHGIVAALSGSNLPAQFVRDLRLRTKVFDKGRLPERFVPGCREHSAIIDAVVSGDVQAAETAMRTHLDNVRESIMTYLKRLSEGAPRAYRRCGFVCCQRFSGRAQNSYPRFAPLAAR